MTTNIARTLTSNGSRRKGTLSFWYKKCEVGTSRMLFSSYTSGGNNHNLLTNTNDTLRWASQVSSSEKINLITNRVFRDTNAWYHIVLAFDTEQGTAANRAKMYINGVQETSFSTEVYPSQNDDLEVNKSGEHIYFNKNGDGAGMEAICVYSHIHYIDGTMYDASTFGETDANGVWKIKTEPSVTYGTNGFFILKDGNSVTDQSGNSNNFTVEQGTLTNTEDCPSNVFATINPLDNFYPNSTITNGNTTIATASSNRSYNTGTLGASSGKWYWEVKGVTNVTSSNGCYIGIASTNPTNDGVSSAQTLGYKQYDYSYYSGNGNYFTNNTLSSYGDSYGDNDIIGVALDLDNNKLYFSKNGTWQNSGDPTSGATGTGAISIQDPSGTVNGVYTPGLGDHWTSGFTVSFNFGNGYFGTTAVASAGTNASGIGIFEYDVPTGYTALSTKGLNL